ncbi:RNA polymerase sigma factor SigZ [Paenibacillus sp. 7124]|uniref:RNA polymerase sigma factor SigZ n=1 Tax=Paenibacillus apii TaxID=1850370 RepID=A0A6M1PGL0_9BACL|nr:RNA polymerase sigma factor SigZ [Paenibacillus apii]NGM82619.1 RNA polymerase sigma factor SigZ [Paenibacillus apii]NJJ39759.1 RNA polymerase sigma factor SigZ [Paenibacillus apii]
MRTQHNELFELYDQVKRFVAARVKCSTAVDDIVQNVYLKAYANLASLTDPTKIKPWVYQIARNSITDYYRLQVHKTVILDELELSVSEDSAREDFSQEVLFCMKEAIRQLPAAYHNALTLYLEGLTHKQVSESLGISLSGAKSRIQRGRERIRRKLTGCCHIEADRYGNIVDFAVKERFRRQVARE